MIRIKRRIAAATLALALALGGAVGYQATVDDHRDETSSEVAGGTWSRSVPPRGSLPIGGGDYTVSGGTWS
jgi:hypothetical protein